MICAMNFSSCINKETKQWSHIDYDNNDEQYYTRQPNKDWLWE